MNVSAASLVCTWFLILIIILIIISGIEKIINVHFINIMFMEWSHFLEV